MAKKRKSRRKGLASFAEEFAISLLFEASGGKIGRVRAKKEGEEEKDSQVSFRDRRALLDSMTKLLGAQGAPEDDDEDGIESFRERLKPDDSDSRTLERGTDTPGDSDEV